MCFQTQQLVFADYGKLGHGEVVGMKIPEQSIEDFAKVYFSLFSPKGGKFSVYYYICYESLSILHYWFLTTVA